MVSISEINVTDKSKKKIQSIAKNCNLDFDLVYYLFSFHWNFDGLEGDWVNNLEKDKEYKKRQSLICENLKIEHTKLDKNQVVESIQKNLSAADRNLLKNNFIYGSANRNYCLVSEFASYYYLNNSSIDKLYSLDWETKEYNIECVIKNLFFKVFRGGSVDRYRLEYLYADLIINMPYSVLSSDTEDWSINFISEVEKNEEKVSLTDLKTLLKPYLKGDKYFLQTILEALSYASILKVAGHSIEDIFIPDYRNKLSEHNFANEWTYPLRFWRKNK